MQGCIRLVDRALLSVLWLAYVIAYVIGSVIADDSQLFWGVCIKLLILEWSIPIIHSE